MKNIAKEAYKIIIRPVLRKLGFDIIKHNENLLGKDRYPLDFENDTIKICDAVKAYTMTSPERINAVINAVNYLVKNNIEGAMVECGVWKGGSAMAMALTLNNLTANDRKIYLYDTFSGMSAPTDIDISLLGESANKKFSNSKISQDTSSWCFSSLEEVKENIAKTGYPQSNVHFVEGKVENTLPNILPGKIALLRLDTDWYESTKHELVHLFPLLSKNGILIVDDYGYWKGQKKAVDEYFAENNISILLNRIDYTGRLGIKTSENA